MLYEKIELYNKKYEVLNPSNWEELRFGLHNDILTLNKNTEVKSSGVSYSVDPMSIFDD